MHFRRQGKVLGHHAEHVRAAKKHELRGTLARLQLHLRILCPLRMVAAAGKIPNKKVGAKVSGSRGFMALICT